MATFSVVSNKHSGVRLYMVFGLPDRFANHSLCATLNNITNKCYAVIKKLKSESDDLVFP